MVNDKMVNSFMEKKIYISPVSESMNLHAMQAMMDSPMFGPASVPKTLAPKRPDDKVF